MGLARRERGRAIERRDVVLDSIVAIRMARAAQREGLPADGWFNRAKSNAIEVLAAFGRSDDGMATHFRPTLRSIPWFEGVYETFFRSSFDLSLDPRTHLDSILRQLVALMNDTANGFCLIPQADDVRDPADPALPSRNWNNLADLPLAVKPIPEPSANVGGPLSPAWVVGDVEHVAARSPQGDLLVFFISPNENWQVFNVSQKVGQKIEGAPSASWVVGDVEHVAAGSPQGDLLVFFISPDENWQVFNVSQQVGQKIEGAPSASWVVGDVEHVAACSPQGDLLVFFISPNEDWQVVQRFPAGRPEDRRSAYRFVGGRRRGARCGRFAAGRPAGLLLSPDEDWQVVNVSQKVGQKIEGAPSAAWVVGDVEHVAARSPQGDLLVFFISPNKNWQVFNVSQQVGQKIEGAPSASWVVGDVEHVAAGSPQGDLLVFFISPNENWQVFNVSSR